MDEEGRCLEAYKLPVKSAQAAELIALTRACLLAENKAVTIYTHSKYAFSAAHDFSKIWENRGFVTTAGKPIQHAALIKELLAAMMLPAHIAIVKCAGHAKVDSKVARGNNLADACAKNVVLQADFPSWMNVVIASQVLGPPFTINDLIAFQTQASEVEIKSWN